MILFCTCLLNSQLITQFSCTIVTFYIVSLKNLSIYPAKTKEVCRRVWSRFVDDFATAPNWYFGVGRNLNSDADTYNELNMGTIKAYLYR